MAQIGTCWKQTSWAVPAWDANTWASALLSAVGFWIIPKRRRRG